MSRSTSCVRPQYIDINPQYIQQTLRRTRNMASGHLTRKQETYISQAVAPSGSAAFPTTFSVISAPRQHFGINVSATVRHGAGEAMRMREEWMGLGDFLRELAEA